MKKSVLITYACDSDLQNIRVQCFIDQLHKNGFTVYYDKNMHFCRQSHSFIEFDLGKYDHVLMICTPQYKVMVEKQVECREGGAFDEFLQNLDFTNKFVPILLEGSPSISFPKWVKETKWINLSDPNCKDLEYKKLIKHLKSTSYSTVTQVAIESKIIKIILSVFMCGLAFYILPITIHQFRITIVLGLLSIFVAFLSLIALAINHFKRQAWLAKLWALVVFCTSFLGGFVSFNAIEIPIPSIIPGSAGVVRERPETIKISAEEGLEIYYTLDGSDPKNERQASNLSDMAGSVNVTISQSTNVSARAKFMLFWSDMAKDTYTFVKPAINEVESPYSDDFLDVKSYEENSGEYILWDNKYIFRKYSLDSFTDGCFRWGYALESNEKKICCMYSDGTTEELFSDNGYGPLYFANDKLFMNKYVNNIPHVYSVDIRTKETVEYSEGEIIGMDNNQNFIIFKRNQMVYAIDVHSQSIVMEQEATGGIIGIRNNNMYYATCEKREDGSLEEKYVLELKKLSFDTYTETNLATLPHAFSADVFVSMPCIETAQFQGNDIFLAYGTRGGTLHYYTGYIVRFELLSCEIETMVAHSSNSDFLITNTENQPFLYYFTEQENVSRMNISTRVVDHPSIGTLADNDVFEDESGLCFYGKNNVKYTLIGVSDYEKYGYEKGNINQYADGSNFSISEINEFADKIFFRLDIGYHDPTQDVGWRPYYVRSKTQFYYKEIYSGMNTLIYEVD
ncbi:hypothetical protein D7X94_11360 [Acutalibacter sp. 1XD8-33]|uniref:chitobiase/beta-hexosaminidase C-terminal domain-containing protein n=1 Tax=Acutalibacter sp. 1XD8-33 TaxID=2320081 RepID=UPI000EA059FF|nr:chitobiase/beta-hexosaminidase C-terminal domain-containing protein [Acutalibacter sp. 1XD8-33]RKJ39687.1 hypothetical protein D7X94_11360 [Acutalibacter sp. 1XD8-33]